MQSEQGATMVLTAMAAVTLIAMVGLAVDVGRMFAARAELTRAADAAALAGVLELPDLALARTKATQYLQLNEPTATAVVNQVGSEKRLSVQASKTIPMTILSVINAGPVTISTYAEAGVGDDAIIDAVIVLDTTGSMSGQKIVDAKVAAKAFVDKLIAGSTSANVSVGLVPFRNCYRPPGSHASCLQTTRIQALTGDKATVKNAIDSQTASGNTNICTGLQKAKDVMRGSGRHTDPKTRRYIVLLSDGSNHHNYRQYAGWDADCDPGNDLAGGECTPSESGELTLDRKTRDRSNDLKNLDTASFDNKLEIYVVGYGVCGSPSSALCNSSLIGQYDNNDSPKNRNLLKCIASSKSGSNDHYFETTDSSQFLSAFEAVADAITWRLSQ